MNSTKDIPPKVIPYEKIRHEPSKSSLRSSVIEIDVENMNIVKDYVSSILRICEEDVGEG
jgi:hypothetical protein